jgi:hypothetical protein
MANEFGVNVDRYPANGGMFWLMVNRNSGEWVTTLRTKANSPTAIGIEVARFNPMVAAKYPQLTRLIVDTLNVAAEADPGLDAAEAAKVLMSARTSGWGR